MIDAWSAALSSRLNPPSDSLKEIESIVCAPVAFGRAAGIATPTLDAIEAICVRLGAAKGLYTP